MTNTIKAVKPRVTTPAFESKKATKKATTKPSTAVIILQDSDKITIAPALELASDYIGQGIKLQDTLNKFAKLFCGLMSDMDATSQKALAYKKHIYETVSKARGVVESSVSRPLNLAIKEQVNAQVSKGGYKNLGWQASKQPSAQSMTKKRVEYAKLSDSDLEREITASAEAKDFRKAVSFADEVTKREEAKASEIKRTEGKATTAMKNDVKKFITGASAEAMTAFIFTQNNIELVLKLAKQSV